ncbi:MAG: TMEM165/GDT1 family protein [Candidatus Omnitrophota bacterium]
MDWKVFLMTFSAIFLAELADKTQLVGMGLSAKTGRPVSVWLGSVCAYIVVTAITVILGALLGKYIKPEIIRYCGAAVFLIIALLMALGKI